MEQDQGWWSRNMGGQPRARQEPAQAPPPPQQQFQQPQQYGYPQQQVPHQPHPQQNVQVTTENFMQAVASWQGGEAHRTEQNRCPRCGSDHFFSRSQGTHRGPPPAPHCADCGFNGLFEQANEATWQSGAA